MNYYCVLVLLHLAWGCWSRAAGPPLSPPGDFEAVCEQLWPRGHGTIEGQQVGDGGFQVLTNLTRDNAGGFVYSSGQTYSVIILSTGAPFRGFLVQARSSPGDGLIGSFTVSNPNLQQTLNCDPAVALNTATASHRNLGSNDNFQSVNLLWTAPNLTDPSINATALDIQNNTGVVNISFTIVVRFDTYYIARNAADQAYTGTPGLVTPLDYPLTYRTPLGCVLPNCSTFVGVAVSNVPGYLQFFLQGRAAAWVAMGFSLTRNMFDADVMACNIMNNQTGEVELLDTWNPSSPTRSNLVDTAQDGVLLNSSVADGFISCTFVRSVAGTILASEDINLNQTLFGMWGLGQQLSPGRLLAHAVMPRSGIPQTSFQPLNPAVNTDADRIAPPANDFAAYNLSYRTPRGCLPPNCTIFVGVAVNARDPAYLDFFMQGQATAWIAMGFSLTRNMFDADIVACNVNPDTNLVEALDVWTPPSPSRAATTDTQQDVLLVTSSVQDGQITCTLVRSIAGTSVSTEDLNLNQTLFGMWGVGQTQAAGRLTQHSATPTTSVQPLNPAVDTNLNRIVETPRNPEDYRLTLRVPDNCTASNCSVFVGIDTNNVSSQFLDIYMEAQTTSWVAVGFTLSRNMFSTDVLGCNLDPATGMVQALDTWNPPQPARRNDRDNMQDVTLFSSNVTDGRLSCTIARYIPGSVNELGNRATEDVNLNNNFFMLYGIGGATPTSNALVVHNTGPGNPRATAVPVNPVTDDQTALNAGAGIPAGVVQPNRNPADYRLSMRTPSGCVPAECDVFVGIDTNTGNNQYLDITIQGNAQGWVAVGFSDTQNMMAADVMGCNVNQDSGLVQVLDTWNLNQGRGNVGDNVQDTFLFQGSRDGQRISCTFSRLIAGTDTTGANIQDLDLNIPYFAMYGVGPVASATNLPPHNLGAGNNPALTGGRVSAVTDTGDVQGDPSRAGLIRAHGILMIIAWPVMAVTAIFFAAWMRPALPNGQWFQVHRILLLGSIFVAIVGFMLIFIANRNNSPPGLITLGSANPVGTAHYVFGIVIMFMHILNPLIAACRCKPDDKQRWIFNLIHGSFVGMVVELMALTNIGMGLALFGGALSTTGMAVFWLYIGYLGFFLGMVLVLFLLFTLLAYGSTGEDKKTLAPSLVKPLVSTNSSYAPANSADKGVELAVPGQPATTNEKEMSKPKPPSKDAPIRWFSLLVYAAVMIPVMIILIILVAI